MPNSLDRLERLFSKRKGPSTANDEPTEVTEIIDTSFLQQTFPQPSFIRPKGSRMIARDERIVTAQNARRAQSLPEPQLDRVSIHGHKLSSASTSNLDYTTTSRSATIIQRRRELNMSSLHEFQFPIPPTQSGEVSPTSPTSTTVSPTTAPIPTLPLRHRHSSLGPTARADTPPASDHEDESNFKRALDKQLPSLPRGAPPTPQASPEMKPVPDSRARESGLNFMQSKAIYAPAQRRRGKKTAALRRAQSHSNISASSEMFTNPINALFEPNFRDFMQLSDDDIAEEAPVEREEMTPAMTPPLHDLPTPPGTASAVSSPASTRSASTHVATSFDSPLAAGALEAARIAAKHKFDLVYVVNLWPDKPEGSTSPVQPSTSTSTFDTRPTSTRSSLLGSMDGPLVESAAGMKGRLLAAYGLSNVANPFRISAAVHAKILRHEGWIEYRSDGARANEFSRGYGHAFHTGHYVRRSSADAVAPKSTGAVQEGEEINRGIVFAAYRQPRKDGTPVGCTSAELEAVREDAKGLVDMLITTHKARRLKKTAQKVQFEHTGPAPAQMVGSFV